MKFALLGCGRIGMMHAGIIARLPQAELAVVFDVNTAASQAVSDRHGGQVAGSPQEAIATPGVDAVLIASSTNTHADLIEMAAKAGKAILCEKPIDLGLDRVMACQAVLDAHPTFVQIGFNRRFDLGHATARQALRDGEIGALKQVIITSRDPGMPPRAYYEVSGGLLRDMTIHDFDLARFFLGEEPTEVFAIAGRQVDPQMMAEIDDHDSAAITMRTAAGKMCVINNYRAATYGYDQRVELLGERGMLLSNNRRDHALEKSFADRTASQAPLTHFFIERYMQSYETEIEEFVANVTAGGQPSVTFHDGVRALQLAEAAYRSVASGKMEPIPA